MTKGKWSKRQLIESSVDHSPHDVLSEDEITSTPTYFKKTVNQLLHGSTNSLLASFLFAVVLFKDRVLAMKLCGRSVFFDVDELSFDQVS